MEELALELRRQWGVDMYAPIDIFSLVSGKTDNLTLAWLDMDGSISGLSSEFEGDSLIILNSNHSKGRQNFTLAHELYHLNFDESKTSYCRINSENPIEKKANQFASYFLMPRYALEDFCFENHIVQWTLRDMVKCEQLFQISHKAMATRLHEEGYLDDVSFRVFTSPNFSIKKYAARLGFDTSLYEVPAQSKRNYVLGNLIPLVERQYERKNISKDYRNEIFSNIFREDLIDEVEEDYNYIEKDYNYY